MDKKFSLDEARKRKEDAPIEQQIAKREAEVTAGVVSEAKESVTIESLGTFYRRDDGWHAPGGFYGAGTELARRCEEALKAKGDK